MNNDMIERIDKAESHCDEYMRELLANCKAELLAMQAQIKKLEQTRDYVPMTNDERFEVYKLWQCNQEISPQTYRTLIELTETAVIKRANLKVKQNDN